MFYCSCFLVSALIGLLCIRSSFTKKYEPNWDSLDTRPSPSWYDEAKFGIFIHWGVYSVPSFGSEWFFHFWKENRTEYVEYMKRNYPPTFKYQEFAKDFTAEFFNATQWAELFSKSGAKYVILTSKHHEGFALWPSKYSYSWNSQDVGPGRDIVGELGIAVKNQNLKYGLYHSLFEWYNPLYVSDKATDFQKNEFVSNKILPEMYELIIEYEPSVLWSDGEAEAPYMYWNSTEFIAWLYNESPVKDEIVTNDRWGKETACKHGDFYNCFDRYNPRVLLSHKWENAMSIDKLAWGFRRNARLSDYLTISELIKELVTTVSCGGNLLMNIGPSKEGIIKPIFEERLLQTGEWLSINGEAIYETRPWKFQNDSLASNVWYTTKDPVVYAMLLNWDDVIFISSPLSLFEDPMTRVVLLGNEINGDLKWSLEKDFVSINLPNKSTVVSQWAYVLKIIPSASGN